jgi:hypothetical protein
MGEMLSIEYLQRMRKGVEQDDYRFHQQGILNLIDSHIEANTMLLNAEEKLAQKYVNEQPRVRDLVSHGQLVTMIITRMEQFGWAGEPRLLEFANVLATEITISEEVAAKPSPQAEYQAILIEAEKLSKNLNTLSGSINCDRTILDLITRLTTLVGGHQHCEHLGSANLTSPPVG